MKAIILCGGSGTRLWPLSRKNFPKQFLKLYSDNSLLQETFLRTQDVVGPENIYFVTNQEGYFNVFDQIEEIYPKLKKQQIIIEPNSLNTAPAIALAFNFLKDKEGVLEDEPIIFLAADQYIGKPEEYAKVVKTALENVADNVGTIGIKPTSPHTGFGYIRKGEKKGEYFQGLEFKEKPDLETAKKYLSSGEYVWNGGMYIFNEKTFTQELQKHAPEIFKLYDQSHEKFLTSFENMPDIAIDVAISEKSDRVVIFEGDFDWNDVGSFDALSSIMEEKNINQKKCIQIDCKNIFTYSSSEKLIATVDVEDLIIVENNDAILVQKKGKSEGVKKVVNYLKENEYPEIGHNVIGYRPWGRYEVLIDDKNHKVKKIIVRPGASLSLQSHEHRSEHWVVVKGEAVVINGDKELTLGENESTYIPAKHKHRLSNRRRSELEIIEVQTGDYLEEDDIVRYDDVYGRGK